MALRHSFIFGIFGMLFLLPNLALANDDTPRYMGPFPDLVEIPLIKTEPLEEMVARQIQGYQKSLLRLAKLEPPDAATVGRAYGMLGQVYHAYEWIGPARRCYINAVKLNPKAFSWNYLLGLVEVEMGNSEVAEKCFQAALELKPHYLATKIHLGNIRLQFNDGVGGAPYFQQVIDAEQNSAAAWLGLGRSRYAEKKYEESLKAYSNAAKLAPRALKINYFIALTYRAMGDEQTARAFMARAGKTGVKPIDPLLEDVKRLQRGERVFLQKGQAAFGAGQYQDAAKMFQMALDSNPNSVPARINLGTSLGVLGNIEEAVKQFQAALSKQPNNVTAHFNLGKLFASAGQHEVAIKHFDQAIAVTPEDATFHLEKAASLTSLNRDDEALAIYSELEKLAPDQVAAPLGKVNLLLKKKMYDETLLALETYRQKFPGDRRLAQNHAQLLVGHPQAGKRNGERALKIALQLVEAEKSPYYFQTVAMAYAELGKCDRAAKWQAKALDMFRAAKIENYVKHGEKQLKTYTAGGDCGVPSQKP